MFNELIGKKPSDLFPDLFIGETEAKDAHKVIKPPDPDLNWLNDIFSRNQKSATDAPQALVTVHSPQLESLITQHLTSLGYTTCTAKTASQAIELLKSTFYHLVFCGINNSFNEVLRVVHSFSPAKRRKTLLALVGPDVHTLYDLQALSLSANLVVNSRDLAQLSIILTKAIRDYEQLFGPMIETLENYY